MNKDVDIIGLPSGEVITISEEVRDILINERLIRFELVNITKTYSIANHFYDDGDIDYIIFLLSK